MTLQHQPAGSGRVGAGGMPAGRRATRLAVLGLFWLLGLPAGAATQWSWNPSIWVGASYNDNLRFATGADSTADAAARIGLVLPFVRQTAGSHVYFGYQAAVTRHQEAKSFDNVDHRLNWNSRWQSSRGRGSWGLLARIWRTQDPIALPDRLPVFQDGGSVSDEGGSVSEDVETALARRLQRDSGELAILINRNLGKRWGWSGSLSGGFVRARPLGAPSGGGGLGGLVEDKDVYGVGTGWSFRTSRRLLTGLHYTLSRASFELTPDETIHQARLRFLWDVSRRLALDLEAGGFRRSRPEGTRMGQPTAALEETDFQARIGLRFNEGLTAGPVQFGFGFGVQPSTGEALRGSSVRTGGSVSISNARPVAWDWRLKTGYYHRSPTDPAVASSDFADAALFLERRFKTGIGFQLTGLWVEQSSAAPELEGEFFRAELRIAWNILGPRGRTSR